MAFNRILVPSFHKAIWLNRNLFFVALLECQYLTFIVRPGLNEDGTDDIALLQRCRSVQLVQAL
jgi:hypothetical protein